MYSLILSSLRFYWRTHLGVLAGAMLASAVLTGALLVGDSVDYSLRTFAMNRLAGIHFAADTQNQYFQDALAPALAERAKTGVAAALQLRGMAIVQGGTPEDHRQINQVTVLGVDFEFWDFALDAGLQLAPNETALSAKLAAALGVEAGDEISLRIAKPSLMSRDAPLSWRGEENSIRGNYIVKRVVPDNKLGRFSLAASQIAPYNAFISRTHMQELVDLPGRANLLLAGGGASLSEMEAALRAVWEPEHIGLKLHAHESGVVQLDTDRVFLDLETTRAAFTVPGARGTLAYMINGLAKGAAKTPYSFVVAGPVPEDMRDDEIVLNRWTADQLDARLGDTIAMRYSELLANNDFIERERTFTLHGIREMEDLEAEHELMPNFPGLSDVESCSDWDVGMPMDEEILSDPANEEYWDLYHQTPKAFVTLKAGQEMWANRFGNLTAIRYPGGEDRAAALRDALKQEIDPKLAGLFLLPVYEQAMAAVSQAMDFGGLFLGMSFFLIVAALMLTGLLFVFGVQQRASQMGVLLALGFRPGAVRRLFLGEGFVIALLGTVAGAGLGTFYTRALIYGLGQYWQGAVANTTILYHAKGPTLVLGASIGLVCALATMVIAMKRQSKHSARELLSMDFTQDQSLPGKARAGKRGLFLSIAGILLAGALVLYVQLGDVSEVAPVFFGAGALMLMAGLGLLRHALQTLNAGGGPGALTLRRLALQNVARRQGRSLAVAGLLACGCFMVFAVSAMQEDLEAQAHKRSSGTGGFSLVADSTFPLLEDPLAEIETEGVSGIAIKVRDGDDASCLNLNHAQTPRMLGVNVEEIAARGAFADEAGARALWELLNLELDGGAVPALVGDANTAMWNLRKKTGVEKGAVLLYQDAAGNEVKVKLVGALPMRLSVFQGAILLADENFTRLYPAEAGHRMFLIDAPADQAAAVAARLREKFDRFGLDAVPAVQRLLEFYAVETTYLAMFLVLGGLGLAIGSAGMGVVVLRNLLERRGELAMLRALGFDHAPIYRILFTEYGFLLAAGLGIGGIAAAVAMLPALLAADATLALAVQLRIALLVVLICAACMTAAIRTGFRKGPMDMSALRSE